VVLQRNGVSYQCATRDPHTQRTKNAAACPRDPALEARVWQLLSRIALCRRAREPLDQAELRLRFSAGRAAQPRFSIPEIASSLNLRAVSRCVARGLAKVRATRTADTFEVSFRFSLLRED
jgi:hypothetical protein